MVDLRQPVFDAISTTEAVQGGHPIVLGALTFGQLNTIIGQDDVDFVGHGLEQMLEEVFWRSSVLPLHAAWYTRTLKYDRCRLST
jgi:hypothetical protein